MGEHAFVMNEERRNHDVSNRDIKFNANSSDCSRLGCGAPLYIHNLHAIPRHRLHLTKVIPGHVKSFSHSLRHVFPELFYFS